MSKITYNKAYQEFNPKGLFLVRRTFKSNGLICNGGEEFKKDAVDVRRIRQLFEGGFIVVGDEAVEAEVGAVEVEEGSDEGDAMTGEEAPETQHTSFQPKKRGRPAKGR